MDTTAHDFRAYDHCDTCAAIARTLEDPPTQDELRYGA